MFGFILYPIKYFDVCQVCIIALFDLLDYACLKIELWLFAQNYFISGFIYFDKPQKYLFKNTILKLTYGS